MTDWDGYVAWRDDFTAVMDQRYYTPEWLDERIATGVARFWQGNGAAIVAELRRYPAGAIDVHGLVAAGDLAGIIELIGEAEAWGRENGAVAGVIESRAGWARAMKTHGYEAHQIALRKELS
jgi:hypothetical protein